MPTNRPPSPPCATALAAARLAGRRASAGVGLSRAPRHRRAGRRAARPGTQGAVRAPLGRGPRRPRAAPVRAGADTQQGLAPACIDWAAFAAIAGDHSCSSKNMLDNVARHRLDPAGCRRGGPAEGRPRAHRRHGAAGRERGDMTWSTTCSAWSRTRRCGPNALNALRTADTRLQRADPRYATRAGSNNAHFLLPRPRTDTTRQVRRLDAEPGLRDQRGRGLWLVPPERAAEGDAAGQRAARAGRTPGARARDAGRRGLRAALPGGHLRGRPCRRDLG